MAVPFLIEVKYAVACEMLGGISRTTLYRMVRNGDLEATGEGSGRKITIRSLEAYKEGKRGIWRKDALMGRSEYPARPRYPSTPTEPSQSSSEKAKSRFANVPLVGRKQKARAISTDTVGA